MDAKLRRIEFVCKNCGAILDVRVVTYYNRFSKRDLEDAIDYGDFNDLYSDPGNLEVQVTCTCTAAELYKDDEKLLRSVFQQVTVIKQFQ